MKNKLKASIILIFLIISNYSSYSLDSNYIYIGGFAGYGVAHHSMPAQIIPGLKGPHNDKDIYANDYFLVLNLEYVFKLPFDDIHDENQTSFMIKTSYSTNTSAYNLNYLDSGQYLYNGELDSGFINYDNDYKHSFHFIDFDFLYKQNIPYFALSVGPSFSYIIYQNSEVYTQPTIKDYEQGSDLILPRNLYYDETINNLNRFILSLTLSFSAEFKLYDKYILSLVITDRFPLLNVVSDHDWNINRFYATLGLSYCIK